MMGFHDELGSVNVPQKSDGPISFQVELLPSRVAYLVRSGSSSGFRRAVKEASSRWGGMKEPILRVYKNKRIEPWLVQIVELAGIDALVNIDISKFEADRISVQLGIPNVDLANIDSIRSPSGFTSNPFSLRKPGTAPYVLPKIDADLWQIVAAGDLTNEVEKFLLEDECPIQRTEFPDFIARSVLSKSTMLDATVKDFDENWASNISGEIPALIWVTKPNSLVDCLWFWNLRVLAPLRFSPSPMFILPIYEVSFWIDFQKNLNSAAEAAAARMFQLYFEKHHFHEVQ